MTTLEKLSAEESKQVGEGETVGMPTRGGGWCQDPAFTRILTLAPGGPATVWTAWICTTDFGSTGLSSTFWAATALLGGKGN